MSCVQIIHPVSQRAGRSCEPSDEDILAIDGDRPISAGARKCLRRMRGPTMRCNAVPPDDGRLARYRTQAQYRKRTGAMCMAVPGRRAALAEIAVARECDARTQPRFRSCEAANQGFAIMQRTVPALRHGDRQTTRRGSVIGTAVLIALPDAMKYFAANANGNFLITRPHRTSDGSDF